MGPQALVSSEGDKMSELRKKCEYVCRQTGWKCQHEALEHSQQGFCIFHERKKEKNLQEFNKGISDLLTERTSGIYRFDGFFFPDGAHFKGCWFWQDVSFCDAEFSGENTEFSEANFRGEKVDFSGAKFFSQRTFFDGTCFSGLVDFRYSQFRNSIVFRRTNFATRATFTRVDLTKCYFREADLRNVDLALVDWDWKCRLRNETEIDKRRKRPMYLDACEIYRQLKVHFHLKRDFSMAGMFHFREQECKRKACKFPSDLLKWAFLRFLKWSCGYGEKLSKVFIGAVELIIGFAIVYMWWFGLYQDGTLAFRYKIGFNTTPITTIVQDFLTSVSFSAKGFFPLWRFQRYEVVGDFANLVAGLEFLLGAFMVGLFIYVFRRRMEK
jgi:uncharacterized protein YjbI with pentapeptide repeats